MSPHGLSILEVIPADIPAYFIAHLSHHDLRELRQTCKAFLNVVDPYLFRQISISKLHYHKNLFDRIRHSSRIAPMVKHIVWLEFPLAPVAEEWAKPLLENLELSKKARDLHGRLLEKMWAEDCSLAETTCTCDEKTNYFIHALSTMPNVSTFTSQPIRPHHIKRVVGPNESSVVLQLALSGPRNWHNGLFDFLLPSMDNSASTVKQLIWKADAAHWDLPLPLLLPTAFHHLTMIDLSINWDFLLFEETTIALGSCLAAATGLYTLALQFPAPMMWWQQERISGVFDTLCSGSQWDNLRSFRSNRHAHTLNYLQIDGCTLEEETLQFLSNFPRLHVNAEKPGGSPILDMTDKEVLLLYRLFQRELREPGEN